MADEKRDHLALCNEHRIPFQEFMAAHCSRCFQSECTRSMHGKSKFEVRAQNWESTLFTNVSKLDPNDDRFKEIVGKKFLSVLPTVKGAPSAWMDPREVEPTRAISIPSVSTFQPVPKEPEIELPRLPEIAHVPSVKAAEALPVTMEPVEKPVEQPAPAPVLRNTLSKSKQMIGGGGQNAPSPVLDPWQPKQALKPGETLVEPGARIKLGR